MKTNKQQDSFEKLQEEEIKNTEIVSSDEEISENNEEDNSPQNNLASFITTPYERVLSIINEAKAFILSASSTQENLIKGLEWAIKVISSHNLYAYELKDQVDSKEGENEAYKQFVQFVNSYNDVIPTNNKKTGKGKSFLLSSLDLKRPSALKYNMNKIEEEKNHEEESTLNVKKNLDKIDKNDKSNSNNHNNENNKEQKNNKENKDNKGNKSMKMNNSMKKGENGNKKNNSKVQNIKSQILKSGRAKSNKKIKPLSPIKQYRKTVLSNYNKKMNSNKKDNENNKNENPITGLAPISETKSKGRTNQSLEKSVTQKEILKDSQFSPKSTKIIKTFNRQKTMSVDIKSFSGGINLLKSDKPLNLEDGNSLNKSFTKYSSNLLENALIDINYPPSRIIEKTFNIFELKEIIGQDNVLPIMGKVILDSFGLYSDDIISTEKLDPFLVSISNQYYKTTLYHNSMHGADVTQSLCLYFLNSNAEEICQSLVLDLLGILIAALGHDLGHPGLTNPFHINSSSELAITYNDVSCLENFHTSKLFRTIRKPETDIFEKLSVQDYKTIRKRMIGNILSTDMANHGKIMTVIKSRIAINKAENKTKFELLSGNEKTKFEEQQSLFDFLIHAADLAHNTKLFNISLKWVELLSEEFWLQGDKEKSMNLPVSFLCDRDSYNIPQSQVGFIKGFIIPTFDCLVNIFPSLKYTMDNAKTNLKKWEKLASKGRLKGWTPEKTKQVNYKKKMILFSAISSMKENSNIKAFKRRSGNVNSLSHALQIKEIGKETNNTKDNEKTGDKKVNKEGKNKIQKPIIINKTKNHDKKVNIIKFQKFK